MPRKSDKYKRRYPRKQNMTRQLKLGVSNAQLVKLRYCEFFNIDGGVNSVSAYVFRANDLFDPNLTGTGHQPHFFDQYMGMYNHFTVLGSKISATGTVYATSASDSVIFGVQLKASSTVDQTSPVYVLEQGHTKWKQLTSDSGSDKSRTVTQNYSAKRFFNVMNPIDEHDLRGDVATSPTEGAYYHVICGGVNTSDNPTAINVRVTIDYVVMLTEPKSVGES